MPESPRDAGIVLRDVGVDLDGQVILRDITLTLDARRIAVIGANGSGKSTFARLLNGLVRPSRGTVRVQGEEPATARGRVGFVFSSPDAQLLLPTPAEDLALSLRPQRLPRQTVRERVTEVLAEYGLADLADRPVHTLSGGQKQLLACASVLVTRPRLLVADEPTTLLDLANARRVGDLLIEELPMPTVIVTHDLALAERCDTAVLFERGRVARAGSPADVVAEYRDAA